MISLSPSKLTTQLSNIAALKNISKWPLTLYFCCQCSGPGHPSGLALPVRSLPLVTPSFGPLSAVQKDYTSLA